MKENKINVLKYFLQKYRAHTFFVFIIQLAMGVLEGLGVAALLPLISTILDQDAQTNSSLYMAVSNIFSTFHVDLSLENTLIVIVILFGVKAGLKYVSALYTSHMASTIVYDFRNRLVDALLRSKWAFFIKTPTGHFTNALLVECQRAGGCFKSLADIVAALLQISILMVIAALASWELIFIASLTSVLLWLVLYRFIRVTGQAGLELKDTSKKISAAITDTLQNIKPLKAMNLESKVFNKISQDIFSLFNVSKRQMMAKQSMDIFHEPLFITIMCAGVYVSIEHMQMETSILMVLAAIFYRFIISWKKLQQAYQVLSGQQSFFWSLQNCIKDAESQKEEKEAGAICNLEQSIIFENVSFSYDAKEIITNLNIEFPARKLIGLCGPSGTGKTTIIDLICRLYSPQGGRILIDDKPINELDLSGWRKSIGYVPQEFVIFNDTIKQNITLGDDDITDEMVVSALKNAEAWEFVCNLPRGIDTPLGERGGRLSGGQRQRISIARALVRSPSILIIDEATASLDPKTEIDIFETLHKLSKSITIISISHQNTIHEKADIIIDLGKQKI